MTDTPAPLALTRVRHDGWTPIKQRRFIEELADSGCVSHAARVVGMSPQSAYNLRRRAANSMFVFGWDVAIKLAQTKLIDAAVERALAAEETPIFYKGEQIGTRRRYDNRLLSFLIDRADKLDRVGLSDDEVIEAWPVILDKIDTALPPAPGEGLLARGEAEGQNMLKRQSTSSTSDWKADWKPGRKSDWKSGW